MEEESVLEEIIAGSGLLEVTSHIDNFGLRKDRLEALGERGAAHLGHNDVREDYVNGFAETLGDFESFGPILRGEDPVAG